MAGESRLWDRWQARLTEKFFVQRIENLVGEGVPDVHLLSRDGGTQHWLELKYKAVVPVRATTQVFGADGLRPDQVAWLWGRGMAGGSVWILSGAAEWTFLVHGRFAREFNKMTLAELKVYADWKWSGRLTADAATGCISILV